MFDENFKNFKNLEKIKSDSIIALRKLKDNNREFDYIYIDGLHEGTHVLMDAIQSFKLLKLNGIIIFDDFMQHDKSLLYKYYEGEMNNYEPHGQGIMYDNNEKILYAGKEMAWAGGAWWKGKIGQKIGYSLYGPYMSKILN